LPGPQFQVKLVFQAEDGVREVGAFEAKNTLGTLLDQVERGEEIIITRHGKAVARLVAESRFIDRDKAARAVAEIVALRAGVTLGKGLTIRELVEEGRE
jgi:prevent-host-death family protein